METNLFNLSKKSLIQIIHNLESYIEDVGDYSGLPEDEILSSLEKDKHLESDSQKYLINFHNSIEKYRDK